MSGPADGTKKIVPYVSKGRSSDGKRWIITAWEGCHRPWANDKCPCFHSDPKFPDLKPGQTATLRGGLWFYEGTEVESTVLDKALKIPDL